MLENKVLSMFHGFGLKMEPGDCPPLNINAMWAVSVKSFLNLLPIGLTVEPKLCE